MNPNKTVTFPDMWTRSLWPNIISLFHAIVAIGLAFSFWSDEQTLANPYVFLGWGRRHDDESNQIKNDVELASSYWFFESEASCRAILFSMGYFLLETILEVRSVRLGTKAFSLLDMGHAIGCLYAYAIVYFAQVGHVLLMFLSFMEISTIVYNLFLMVTQCHKAMIKFNRHGNATYEFNTTTVDMVFRMRVVLGYVFILTFTFTRIFIYGCWIFVVFQHVLIPWAHVLPYAYQALTMLVAYGLLNVSWLCLIYDKAKRLFSFGEDKRE